MGMWWALSALAFLGMQPSASVIEAPGPQGALQGTMLSPAGNRRAVVLIIPGSGPTDRDGNNPLGVRAASYRLLAEDLATRGIATVRVDKRGMFGSRAAVADANAVTIGDYAADVRSWIRAVRERTGAECVWLLGHSEGGLVVLAAARNAPDVCGLILVATPGRRLGEALREQIRSHPSFASVQDQALAAIARLEARQPVDTSNFPPVLLGLFAPQIQPYLMDLLSHDPAALLAGIERPVLVLQGQRDIQVSEEDAQRLAAANRRARLVLLPRVNHVLKEVASQDRAANVATYGDPGLPLAPGVAEAIAGFVIRQRARQ